MTGSLESKWFEICDRLSSDGYESLSDPEKLWVSVRELIDSTNNGGLVSYFYNSGANHIGTCISGLEQLGAGEIRSKLQLTKGLFPLSHLETLSGRNEIINSWPEGGNEFSLFDSLDDELLPKLDSLEVQLEYYVETVLNFERNLKDS